MCFIGFWTFGFDIVAKPEVSDGLRHVRATTRACALFVFVWGSRDGKRVKASSDSDMRARETRV
eukprot:9480101-Pyramimonas_sp.AAC.1